MIDSNTPFTAEMSGDFSGNTKPNEEWKNCSGAITKLQSLNTSGATPDYLKRCNFGYDTFNDLEYDMWKSNITNLVDINNIIILIIEYNV